MEVKVEEVMVAKASFCRPYFNLAEVAAIMWDQDCGSLPILNDAGDVMGMITDRDICIALGTRNLKASDVAVRDVAPARCFGCKPGEDVHSALQTMAAQAIRRLPVVDEEGKLAGILSIDDIILHARAGARINFTVVMTTLRAIVNYRGREHGVVAAATAAGA